MKDERGKREGPTRKSAKNPRADRLRLALRENLKRRKSQARARSDAMTAPSDCDDVATNEIGENKPGK